MKEYYLQKAETNLPELFTEPIAVASEQKILRTGDDVVLDLGNHYVGTFSFTLGYCAQYPDAPVRLYIKFCETKEELSADFTGYRGILAPTWLQEDVVNADTVGRYQLPRRYAARYIKICVVYAPVTITLSEFVFLAQTSADQRCLLPATFSDAEAEALDRIAVNTLKNCMQRVFEDGPKRDRRLWIGDLRLEALTSYRTFCQPSLVRRCLYLFAAADCDSHGFLPGYVYENPSFVSGYWFLRDYALLFVVTLCDYLLHTGDAATFQEIYPVAKGQMEAAFRALDANGILVAGNGGEAFIDWQDGLKKTAALHGVYLYTLKILCKTLTVLHHEDAAVYETRYRAATAAALKHLYNVRENNFTNSYDAYQSSVHSAVWMILGGVLTGEAAWELLKKARENPESKQPVTPYMNHYLVEAMMLLGKRKEAVAHIKSFWGAMVRQGADTFYEVFVPGQPHLSPYGDWMVNSACHAWNCTPSYFLRDNSLMVE